MVRASLNRLVRSRFRAIVAWAMVPLAVLSGRPVSGCICADGHYEPVCRAALCAGSNSTAGPRNSTSCCGCSCCGQTLSDQSPSRCKDRTSCCQKAGALHPADGRSLSKKCCTPVVGIQAVVKAKVERATSNAVVHSLDVLAPIASVADVQTHGPAWIVPHDTGPPVDLVITLRRLLI